MPEICSHNEYMIIEAAHNLADGEIVMVGTGLPMVATTLAVRTHAPNLIAVVESGPIDPIIRQTPISVSDPRVMNRAARLGSLREVLGCILQRGLVDIGFIGGAQIDRYANINSTIIGDYQMPKVRLPGSGGANDIASHAKRLLIIAPHERRRFPSRCDYITSPGYLDGPQARRKAGFRVDTPPITVVTNLAVMEVVPATGLLRITKLMKGVEVDTVRQNTGFPIDVSPCLSEFVSPTESELRMLREEIDPDGVYINHES